MPARNDCVTADRDVVVWDCADLDMMLVTSSACRQVAYDYDIVNDDDFERILQTVLSAATVLACCRLLNQSRDWSISFKRLPYSVFFDANRGLDRDAWWRELSNRATAEQVAECQSFVADGQYKQVKVWDLCQGHDVAELLAIVFTTAYNCPFGGVVSGNLRVALPADEFARSKVYSAIRAWEARNRPYVVLRDSAPAVTQHGAAGEVGLGDLEAGWAFDSRLRRQGAELGGVSLGGQPTADEQ